MSAIEIRPIETGDPFRFAIRLGDREGATRHEMTMSRAQFEALAGGLATPEDCARAAIRFLLDREPKEAILRRFDIAVIASYFPEFSREFSRYLSAR